MRNRDKPLLQHRKRSAQAVTGGGAEAGRNTGVFVGSFLFAGRGKSIMKIKRKAAPEGGAVIETRDLIEDLRKARRQAGAKPIQWIPVSGEQEAGERLIEIPNFYDE